MCGIFGIYRSAGLQESDTRAVERALEQMRERGPDGRGLWTSPSLILGHRRLAILDPEQGQQPWVDEDSGVVLTYNGEIYNYNTLRSELEARGVRLKTRCDTEMVLQAYLQWGLECLDHLEGMFAFALFDPHKERLWLVRDRLGVKPLYACRQGVGSLCFSSSVASLLTLPGVEAVVDRAALAHYLLTVRTSLGRKTLVKDVQLLEPGEYWLVNTHSGHITTKSYWQLPSPSSHGPMGVEALTELGLEAAQRFDAAVQRQLISDVPVGCFLSGGLDSSILASAIRQHAGERFFACSVGYEAEGYNEWEYAAQAAKRHDFSCQRVVLDPLDYMDDWEELIRFKGLPLSTPNEVPIFRLAHVFSQSCKVALTGEGADEIFGGYVRAICSAWDYDRYHGGRSPVLKQRLQQLWGEEAFTGWVQHFLTTNAWLPVARQASLLADGGGWVRGPLAEVQAWYGDHMEPISGCTTFDAYMRVHARVNLEGLLNRLDTSTMKASVEGRVPFTDHGLAAWTFGLPDNLKCALKAEAGEAREREWTSAALIDGGWVESKRLLRSGYGARIDSSILNRRKMSFPVPFEKWFGSFWKRAYKEAVQDSALLRSLLSPTAYRQVTSLTAPVDGMVAWPLMNLALMERHWGLKLDASL